MENDLVAMRRDIFKNTSIKSPALPDFTELYNFCRARYPRDIWANVDVLYRLIWPRVSPDRQSSPWKCLKHAVGAKYVLEYHLLKNITRNISNRYSTPSKSSILVPFVPCRRDYQGFIYPVTRILAKQSVTTTIFVSKTKFQSEISPELFAESYFLFAEDFQTLDVYRWAKAHYRRLTAAIKNLCIELRLDSRQCQDTKMFFQNYFREKIIFQKVLENVHPSLLYGIHYMLNPGYLAAIDEAKVRGCRFKNILVQHGVFSEAGFHDFKGADHVILWGKYFETVLQNIDNVPIPPSRVIGNPKLEVQLSRLQRKQKAQSKSGEKTILFASTPDTALSGDGNAKALQLFVHTVNNLGQQRIIYKLHPSEDRRPYDHYAQKGLIELGQVVENVSIYDLIDMADVVVGTQSTVLPEAIALGRPVIQLLPDRCQTDWLQYGLMVASTERELCEQIRLTTECPDHRELVLQNEQKLARAMFGNLEGSSRRIADYLKELL